MGRTPPSIRTTGLSGICFCTIVVEILSSTTIITSTLIFMSDIRREYKIYVVCISGSIELSNYFQRLLQKIICMKLYIPDVIVMYF